MAWSLSTGAAVTLSWWGVHTVMAGTAYDRPRALPITAQTPTTQAVAPQASSTARPPSRSPSPSPSRPPSRKPATTPPPAAKPVPPEDSPATAEPESGNVKGYNVKGGRVVFDIGENSAELVSATPAAGWQMQVWKQPTWIRVTFTQDGHEVSVFCTWNGHPPMVQFDER
jgi:cell division septation protein DedD